MKIDYTKELVDPRGKPIWIPDEESSDNRKKGTVEDLLWIVTTTPTKEMSTELKKKMYKLSVKICNKNDLTIEDVHTLQKHIYDVILDPLTSGTLNEYLESCSYKKERAE